MPADPMDQPEGDGLSLVMPFVVCESNGGRYDDAAFAAGWQAGEIDQALKTATVSGAAVVSYPMVHADLVRQLELVGMNRGYPVVKVEPTADGWCAVTFERAAEESP